MAVESSGTIIMNDQMLESVSSFIYLGNKCQFDFDSLVPVNHRIEIARSKFTALMKLWKAASLSFKLKLNLFAATVGTIMKYGCEAWIMTSQVKKRLNGANASMLAVVLKSTSRQQAASPAYDIVAAVYRQRHSYLGHLLRMDDKRMVRKIFIHEMPNEPPYPEGSLLEHWHIPLSSIVDMAQHRSCWKEKEMIAKFKDS